MPVWSPALCLCASSRSRMLRFGQPLQKETQLFSWSRAHTLRHFAKIILQFKNSAGKKLQQTHSSFQCSLPAASLTKRSIGEKPNNPLISTKILTGELFPSLAQAKSWRTRMLHQLFWAATGSKFLAYTILSGALYPSFVPHKHAACTETRHPTHTAEAFNPFVQAVSFHRLKGHFYCGLC